MDLGEDWHCTALLETCTGLSLVTAGANCVCLQTNGQGDNSISEGWSVSKQVNRTLFLKDLVLLMQTLDISPDSLLCYICLSLSFMITLAVPSLTLSRLEVIG